MSMNTKACAVSLIICGLAISVAACGTSAPSPDSGIGDTSVDSGYDIGLDSGYDAGTDVDLFLPDAQTPFIEKGLIIPPNSIPCRDLDGGGDPYNCNHHGSTIAMLKDGTMAVVWYFGQGEHSADSKLLWSRLAPGAKEWTTPVSPYDDPDHGEGNPAIWVDESGTIFIFFVTAFADAWDEAKVRMIKSFDNGDTWTQPVFLREEHCWMTRFRPLRMSDGTLLLPCYNECLAIPTFFRSHDDFKTWEMLGYDDNGQYIIDHISNIQPSLIQRTNGTVVAITRNGTDTRRVGIMSTKNAGNTWTKHDYTELPNSGTSVEQTMLRDGHVVVAFNNDRYERFPLTAALSIDEDLTFNSAVRNINDECPGGGCSYAYPSVIQNTKDGTIWVSYTHNRETIGWIHFNERWLSEGHEQLK